MVSFHAGRPHFVRLARGPSAWTERVRRVAWTERVRRVACAESGDARCLQAVGEAVAF